MTKTQQAPAVTNAATPFDSWPDAPPALIGPPINYGELGAGALVLYAGRHVITTKDGAKFTHQHFVANAGGGRSFALWGAADLNAKLQAVKPASVLFLRYDGKTPHPIEAGKDLHRFTVKIPPPRTDIVAIRSKMVDVEAALDRGIQVAESQDRGRRDAARRGQGGGAASPDFAPPEDTNAARHDLPF